MMRWWVCDTRWKEVSGVWETLNRVRVLACGLNEGIPGSSLQLSPVMIHLEDPEQPKNNLRKFDSITTITTTEDGALAGSTVRVHHAQSRRILLAADLKN